MQIAFSFFDDNFSSARYESRRVDATLRAEFIDRGNLDVKATVLMLRITHVCTHTNARTRPQTNVGMHREKALHIV